MSSSRSQPRVSFASLTPNNLGTVRKLNSVLFPIRYSENFYNDILNPELEEFCKLIYYNDIPVGTFCCRVEIDKDSGEAKLYVMTMGVLAPYRSRGLGSQSIAQILQAAAAHAKPPVKSVYLHVQTSNQGAKTFYERHGFKEIAIHANYYKKIVPHEAWVLERELVADATKEAGAQ